MENSLKQRIVGAVVLIGLAVIFLPSILKEKTESKPFQSAIPAKPIELVEHRIGEDDVQKNQQVINKLDQLVEESRKTKAIQASENDASSQKSLPKPAQSTASNEKSVATSSGQNTIKTSKEKQTIGDNFTDAAWVVRVASFSNLENAKNLVAKLKEAGYKAYRRDGKTAQNKSLYRIYVGPYIEKAVASKQIASISKLSQSKAMLLAYDPIIH